MRTVFVLLSVRLRSHLIQMFESAVVRMGPGEVQG
jgi:hypothetical protein